MTESGIMIVFAIPVTCFPKAGHSFGLCFNTLFALHAYPGYTAHYLRQLYLLKIKLCSKTLDNYV